jgi:hypothetical protein
MAWLARPKTAVMTMRNFTLTARLQLLAVVCCLPSSVALGLSEGVRIPLVVGIASVVGGVGIGLFTASFIVKYEGSHD